MTIISMWRMFLKKVAKIKMLDLPTVVANTNEVTVIQVIQNLELMIAKVLLIIIIRVAIRSKC